MHRLFGFSYIAHGSITAVKRGMHCKLCQMLKKRAAKTLVDKLMFTWQGLTWNMNFTGFMWNIAVHVNLRIDYLQIDNLKSMFLF